MEGVFAAVAGDAKLGQAEDRRLLRSRGFDGRQNTGLVPLPIERRLIQNGGGDPN